MLAQVRKLPYFGAGPRIGVTGSSRFFSHGSVGEQEQEKERLNNTKESNKKAEKSRKESQKYPRRPAEWKPFETDLSSVVPVDGCWKFLNGDELQAISFEESFKVLKEHFESEPVAWVIG
eukprot:CAMPEP_0206459824 /NCGR_PEP_ID=MMETSP0324_2-20121206/24400_1 /ASSEMBLY_ACC=CAM_ASM_000836 /TAXON_ID=2866 /ORGANISM="Crypthecodinium cohnii, Strain Seligo" /LENGTH=119 /DNA_ID=CAMNT_0053931437 /DNA_START=151 /DNA_END=507 /DNA_ORIENTATION=+